MNIAHFFFFEFAFAETKLIHSGSYENDGVVCKDDFQNLANCGQKNLSIKWIQISLLNECKSIFQMERKIRQRDCPYSQQSI